MNLIPKRTKIIGVILLGSALLIGSAAAMLASTLKGDEEVLGDIDNHFSSMDRTTQAIKTPNVRLHSAPPSKEAASMAPETDVRKNAPRSKKTKRRHRRTQSSLPPSTREPWKGIRRIAPTTFEIDEELAIAARANPKPFIRGIRAHIAEENGKPLGFRLSGIRPGGPLFALGLRSGDILLAVNGFALESVDQALMAAASAKLSDKFRVDIKRKGNGVSLYYRVL